MLYMIVMSYIYDISVYSLWRLYYSVCMICEYVSSQWENIKNSSFNEGEVIYHAALTDDKGYIEYIKNDTFVYALFTLILRLIGISPIRFFDTIDDIILNSQVPNVISYYNKGKLQHEIVVPMLDKITGSDAQAIYPKLGYVFINDCHDVTKEYELFRNSLQELTVPLTSVHLMDILLMFKQRNKSKKYSGIRHTICCLCVDTYTEYIFKANDPFIFHDERTLIPQ